MQDTSNIDRTSGSRPSVLVVLPVYNEEKVMAKSVNEVVVFLQNHGEHSWHILIADNNSTDGTELIGKKLAEELPGVEYLRIPRKGRGIALRTVWTQTDCDYVAYMDIDLATSLEALVAAVQHLDRGYDVAVGNRLDKASKVTRSLKREFVSRSYNVVIRAMLNTKFRDAHCGFKTARAASAKTIIPYIECDGWFFDTEFLFYAERLGFKIVELPITWREGEDTKAHIFRDAKEDLAGLWRLRHHNNLNKKVPN